MATYLNLIKKIIKLDAIPLASGAMTMADLADSLQNDPHIQRLLKAGRRATPTICRELRKGGTPLSARAYLFWLLIRICA